jgi:GTP-binding protein Era
MLKAGYVAIIGRPNAGKSTLLNAVLGAQISIVTPKAQTTRERILGIYTDEKKGQIVYIDTPGIHKAREGGINEYMVQEAKEALEAPNLIWYLVDPYSSLEHEKAVIELLVQAPRMPLFLLMNKMDCIGKKRQEQVDQFQKGLEEALIENGILLKKSYRLSALNEEGLTEFLNDSWSLIPEGPFFYPDPDQISDRPTRFFAAEKIREQLFHCLGDEIPYSCAVEVTSFKEDVKPVRIEATIFVERESQKGIVIGQGGKKIKEIGQEARQEIEKFIGEQIFLGLKVELKRNWTQDPRELKRIGYALPSKGRSSL